MSPKVNRVRTVFSWAKVVANVPLGLIAGVVALVTVAQLTEQGGLAFLVAGAATLAVSTVGARQAMRSLVTHERARSAVAAILGIGTLAIATVFAWVVILSPLPASPPPDDTAALWDLPTGSRIAYGHTQAARPVSDTPVILLHGGPGSPDGDASAVAAAIAAAGFDVYFYHQLGAGHSSRLDDIDGYTVARHVADLEAMRGTIGADRIILVGASWGGQLAMNYLAAHPTRVEAVVVSSPNAIWAPAFTDDERLTPGGKVDQSAVIGDHLRFLAPHVLMGIIGPGGAHAVVPDDRADGAFEAMVADLDMWAGCPGRGSQSSDDDQAEPRRGFGFWVNAVTTRDSRQVPDPRPSLRDTSVPLLVLRGECDYLAWEVTREYRDTIPGAVLVPIDGAGHVIWDDQPQLYAELVGAFLRGEPLPREPFAGVAGPWAP